MNDNRRLFLLAAISGMAGSASLAFAPALASAVLPTGSASDTLRALAAAGPEEGRPIVIAIAHGQRPAQHADAAALLAAQGFHVLLPQLRAASAAELGQDLLNFIDRLHMPEAVFVGTGIAADAIHAAHQLRRTRVVGMVLAGSTAPEPDTGRGPGGAIMLSAHATPQQVANAAAQLARQAKWRT